MVSDFHFDEATHTYTCRGSSSILLPLPGVTTILGEWIRVDEGFRAIYVNTLSGEFVTEEVFKAAGDFGTAIHKGVELIASGVGVDWGALDPELVQPLIEFMQWAEQYQPEYLHIEEPMYCERRMFAGTPDIIFKLKGKPGRAVLDVKTALLPESRLLGFAGPQTSGYCMLYRSRTKFRGKLSRYVLRLPKDGSGYKFLELSNPHDEAYFINRLYQFNYLKEA